MFMLQQLVYVKVRMNGLVNIALAFILLSIAKLAAKQTRRLDADATG